MKAPKAGTKVNIRLLGQEWQVCFVGKPYKDFVGPGRFLSTKCIIEVLVSRGWSRWWFDVLTHELLECVLANLQHRYSAPMQKELLFSFNHADLTAITAEFSGALDQIICQLNKTLA